MRSAKYLVLSIFLFSTVALTYQFLDKRMFLFSRETPIWPQTFKKYTIQDRDFESSIYKTPDIKPMPDLANYTVSKIINKITPPVPGKVSIVPMRNELGMDKFSELRRQSEFSALQKRSDPLVIRIESGTYDLEALTREINDPEVIEKINEIYVLRLPLYVSSEASLVIRGTPESPVTLHLSQNRGSFMVNAGKMYIIDAKIAGWNEAKNNYAYFQQDKNFRPFITSWSGSETYMGRSSFYDLGYFFSKSYGITFSAASTAYINKNPGVKPATGWIVNCRFERLYYGFYSYEAADIAIIGNNYYDNIIYGIDPHDRSERLIIAYNETHGTREKHGIIISREVNDGWIVGNKSHNNKGSGIMLDRSSVRNLIADNISYQNGGDGLALFESQDNIIINNKFFLNKRNGLRIRNSWNVAAKDNVMMLNGESGAHVYAQDIRKEENYRDFEHDPFTEKASLKLETSIVSLNRSGGFKFSNIDYAYLADVEFLFYSRKFMRGDFNDIGHEIAYGLARNARTLEFTKAEKKKHKGQFVLR